ncbi:MAG TPA: UDP-N-acetylmuramate dehydrogenase, partial [Saprospiraceae bacterium]|nr:UDP-N-acetylmuramate dehydrogenase [Saprospiraceae bacterium]
MELINNASLKPYVTFGVEANCEHLYRIEDFDELQLAVRYLENPLVLGGGSNVLPIGDLKRNVIKVELKGIEIEEKIGQDPMVHVAGGENWHQFVLWALNKNLGGIENLSLIPGTIGAAPIQNIGAYGVELESVFESLEALRIGDGEIVQFKKIDCGFGYRDSIFKREAKEKYVITGVSLRLNRQHKLNTSYGAIQDVLREKEISNPTIRDVSEAVIAIRQSKLPDPAVIGNAGSFFKNPVITKQHFDTLKALYSTLPGYPSKDDQYKIPAGWLIEQCGWKGKNIGNAGSYEHQALVLVNRGEASGTEIWNLAQEIIKSVNEKFNIYLSPE